MPTGHHGFNDPAVLRAVNALRVTRAASEVCALAFATTPHWHPNAAAALGTPPERGLRALTARPRSATRALT